MSLKGGGGGLTLLWPGIKRHGRGMFKLLGPVGPIQVHLMQLSNDVIWPSELQRPAHMRPVPRAKHDLDRTLVANQLSITCKGLHAGGSPVPVLLGSLCRYCPPGPLACLLLRVCFPHMLPYLTDQRSQALMAAAQSIWLSCRGWSP